MSKVYRCPHPLGEASSQRKQSLCNRMHLAVKNIRLYGYDGLLFTLPTGFPIIYRHEQVKMLGLNEVDK